MYILWTANDARMIRQSCSPIPADVCAEESEPTRCTLTRAVESISDVTEECLVVEALECQEDMQATTCTLTPGQGCEVAAGSGTCTYVAPQAAVASVAGSCAIASGSGSSSGLRQMRTMFWHWSRTTATLGELSVSMNAAPKRTARSRSTGRTPP